MEAKASEYCHLHLGLRARIVRWPDSLPLVLKLEMELGRKLGNLPRRFGAGLRVEMNAALAMTYGFVECEAKLLGRGLFVGRAGA